MLFHSDTNQSNLTEWIYKIDNVFNQIRSTKATLKIVDRIALCLIYCEIETGILLEQNISSESQPISETLFHSNLCINCTFRFIIALSSIKSSERIPSFSPQYCCLTSALPLPHINKENLKECLDQMKCFTQNTQRK